MTSGRDDNFLKFYQDGMDISGHAEIDAEEAQSGEKISIWLAGSIILFLIIIFVISGLLIQQIYFKPPAIRTSTERELQKYKNMIKDNPKNADAYVGLASVYLQINEPDKAIKELNTALKLQPRSWNATFGLGMAYDALNDPDNAISYFWQAAGIEPNNELAFYQLGRMYQKRHLYSEAINAYQKTLKINPTLADAHYYLGQCYEKISKKEQAKKEYIEALRYVESFPEAKKALERLR